MTPDLAVHLLQVMVGLALAVNAWTLMRLASAVDRLTARLDLEAPRQAEPAPTAPTGEVGSWSEDGWPTPPVTRRHGPLEPVPDPTRPPPATLA